MELIIHTSLFSTNFCVDYEGYDMFKVWTLSCNVYLLWIEIQMGEAGISTHWPFRYPQPVKIFICIASSPRLSGTGMTSLNPWYLPLNCQMIAYLSSPLLWELGTNSPQSQSLVKDCQFGVSPVNYSDSDSEIILARHFSSAARLEPWLSYPTH